MAVSQIELNHWRVRENEDELALTAPTTGATFTVNRSGILPTGNFQNVNSEEYKELPKAMRAALNFYDDQNAAFEAGEKARKAALAERQGKTAPVAVNPTGKAPKPAAEGG